MHSKKIKMFQIETRTFWRIQLHRYFKVFTVEYFFFWDLKDFNSIDTSLNYLAWLKAMPMNYTLSW